MYVKDKISFTYVDKKHPNAIRLVQQMNHSNGIVGYVDKKKLPDKFKNKIEKAGKISINPDQPLSYYQDKEFIGNSVIIIDTSELSRNSCLYIVSELQRIRNGSTWNQKFPKSEVINAEISLPVKNSEIDFDFMDTFIAELEAERIAELEAYLKVSGLDNYELSTEELEALQDYDSIEWREFNLEKLFGKSTRGKRLKSSDRIKGDLPFVTAGETNTGISAFIGNDVEVFKANTTTVDMFGSAKYRNYEYGADDHIAVVHTENLNKFASLFVTTAIHRASNTGKFSYDRNFYAKDADELIISLPVNCTGNIDYEFMALLTQAIQKIAIKDVVKYADERIDATKRVVEYNTIQN